MAIPNMLGSASVNHGIFELGSGISKSDLGLFLEFMKYFFFFKFYFTDWKSLEKDVFFLLLVKTILLRTITIDSNYIQHKNVF